MSYHVRLVVAMDRYIEADGPEEAEQLALERMANAIEPRGFPFDVVRTFVHESPSECRDRDELIRNAELIADIDA